MRSYILIAKVSNSLMLSCTRSILNSGRDTSLCMIVEDGQLAVLPSQVVDDLPFCGVNDAADDPVRKFENILRFVSLRMASK